MPPKSKKAKDKKRALIEQKLMQIYNRDGILTPNAVLKEAVNKRSPLHSEFDWSEKSAANKWRLEQARRLIRGVRVKMQTVSHTLAVPAYVRDPDVEPREQGFSATAVLATDEDRAQKALGYEIDRAIASLQRATAIATRFGLEDEITAALESLLGIRDKAA